MTQKEARRLKHGLYRLFWKQGGSSLAAVGSLHDGKRWFAASNWTSENNFGIASISWALVDFVQEVDETHI